jgi:hypothetical protein
MFTTDPNDPRLSRKVPDGNKQGQQTAYLVLSEEERAKGFVRPLRLAYKHVTCGAVTSMSQEIAETYARNPKFYGGTFCCRCKNHYRLIDSKGQPAFLWVPDGSAVGS